jgi:UDP-N-acetylglucosamine:LPS N-acetylglucosamine transferase
MGAIAELAAIEKPCILMPLPDSPQEENAAYFHERAGIPTLGKRASPAEFEGVILGFLKDPRSWGGSMEKFRRLLPPSAAARFASLILEAGSRK